MTEHDPEQPFGSQASMAENSHKADVRRANGAATNRPGDASRNGSRKTVYRHFFSPGLSPEAPHLALRDVQRLLTRGSERRDI